MPCQTNEMSIVKFWYGPKILLPSARHFFVPTTGYRYGSEPDPALNVKVQLNIKKMYTVPVLLKTSPKYW